MSNEELEKTKVIADYLGWKRTNETTYWFPNLYPIYNHDHQLSTGEITDQITNAKFHNSFDWQIPAWNKVEKELRKPKIPFFKFMEFIERYHTAIDSNNRASAFNVLHEAVTFINQKPNN